MGVWFHGVLTLIAMIAVGAMNSDPSLQAMYLQLGFVTFWTSVGVHEHTGVAQGCFSSSSYIVSQTGSKRFEDFHGRFLSKESNGPSW